MKKFFLTLAGRLVLAVFLLLATGCSKSDNAEPARAEIPTGGKAPDEYLEIRINGGNWISLDGLAANSAPQQFGITSNSGSSMFNINWPGGEGYFRWNDTGNIPARINFTYYLSDNTYYVSGFRSNNESKETSGGLLNIKSIGREGDEVSGSFVIGPAGRFDSGTGKHLENVIIEGRFNLKLVKLYRSAKEA